LEQVRRKNPDKDTRKLGVVAKDIMKQRLQRSPDLADALMMRLLFDMLQQPQRRNPRLTLY
jgi:hypothetical protein